MTHFLPSPARLQLLLDMCDRAAARLQARHEAGQPESASLRPQAGRSCAAPGNGAATLLGKPAGGSSWPPAGAVGVDLADFVSQNYDGASREIIRRIAPHLLNDRVG